ncbi:MAG: GHKL domain-containing protein [Ruminiclostridium sp.]|nr:GHKL domain-containing protein [Ruminiclostridium sp.]
MELLWLFFEIGVDIYESFVVIHFICSILKFRNNIKKRKHFIFIGTMAMTALIIVINSLALYEGLLGVLYSVFFFLFSLAFLNGTILQKLFTAIVTNVVLIGVSVGVISLMSLITKDNLNSIYSQHSVNRLLTVVIGQTVLTYVLVVIRHIFNKKITFLKPKEWLLIISVFVISFVAFVAIHTSAVNIQNMKRSIIWLIIAEFCIILINIVCWYITVNVSTVRNREKELLKIAKQNEYNAQYSEIVKSQYEQTRRLRHDMKQHFIVLDRLITNQKYKEAQQLITENYKSISETDVVVDVGNDFVNAILNVKLSEAKSFGICVICSVDKSITGISSTDLCSLIGNLLDNAIEAAKQCAPDNRSIEVNMSSSGKHFKIAVRNSIPEPVLKSNYELLTTKKDKTHHGYGIKTIKFIAEKYNGTTDFYEENSTFISQITLYK